PAEKLLVPATVAAPICTIAPPAVTLTEPLALSAPSETPALSNCRVRLRRLLNPVTADGVAEALTLRTAKSRMLPVVPPTLIAPARLFACEPSRMSELAALDARVVVPPTISGPVWLIEPPEVRFRFRPTVEAPSKVAVLLVS